MVCAVCTKTDAYGHSPASVGNERARFENAIREINSQPPLLGRYEDGIYRHVGLKRSWTGWGMRASVAHAMPAESDPDAGREVFEEMLRREFATLIFVRRLDNGDYANLEHQQRWRG